MSGPLSSVALTPLQRIQTILGVEPDGIWGPKSQAALAAECGNAGPARTLSAATVHHVHASSFADPADIAAFKKCKAKGKTDQECFEVGDNGVGYWGDDTTNVDQPFVALHSDHLLERWGSLAAAKHKAVLVECNGKSMQCIVGDLCGVHERVDLAPGAQFVFGLEAPFLVPATWSWV
jgi:hypothetical protein